MAPSSVANVIASPIEAISRNSASGSRKITRRAPWANSPSVTSAGLRRWARPERTAGLFAGAAPLARCRLRGAVGRRLVGRSPWSSGERLCRSGAVVCRARRSWSRCRHRRGVAPFEARQRHTAEIEKQRRSQKRHSCRDRAAPAVTRLQPGTAMAFTKTTHRANLVTDRLARGVRFIAHSASIHASSCSPPQASPNAAATSKPDKRQRSNNVRAHRTLIVSVILALVLAVPAGAAASRLIIGGSTSVLPLDAETRHRLPQGLPEDPGAEGRAADSRTSASAAPPAALRHRRLLARSDCRLDPKGLVFTKIARDGVCVITNDKNPISNLSQQKRRRHLHGQHPRLERSPGRARSPARSTCSTATAPPVPRTPSSTSSSAKR